MAYACVHHALGGLKVLRAATFRDARGGFTKLFNPAEFDALGLGGFTVAEVYVTTSRRDVVRGLHFQVPPAAHAKLVVCLGGRVLDVGVDLRADSPTYGQAFGTELRAERGDALFLPEGFAHGFRSLEDDSTLLYATSTPYAPQYDAGLRWDSIAFDWGLDAPLLSERDQQHPPLAAFATPFRHTP